VTEKSPFQYGGKALIPKIIYDEITDAHKSYTSFINFLSIITTKKKPKVEKEKVIFT